MVHKKIAEIWPGPHYVPGTGLDGTFKHVLDSAAVEKWRDERSQVPLLHGKQGAGKTTLMAKLAKRLEAHDQDKDAAIVPLLFRTGKNQNLRSLEDIKRAILWHICNTLPLASGGARLGFFSRK